MSTALDMIAKHEQWARRGVTISTTACVAAAAAAALGEHRLLHSAWTDDGIILRSRVHVLIEQPTASGMRATLVPDAADFNAVGVARCLAHPAHQKESERQPATFVITQHAAPWWTHALPDETCTAQLSVGAIVQQPRVVATAHGDQIVVQPTMVVTLAYDARVATQPDADALLCAIKRQLEHLHSL
jgi:pyruvate/2-oxoglutarate dehydrogenase complex dihydrolipoamide acyltransferase (E2) component